jgi:hypothetical protein
MTDSPISLTSLSEWVRALPISSLAPIGVLFAAGLLLLAFGQRLLKPVLVLAAIFGGVIVAVEIGHALGPTVSPLIWSAAGAVLGLIAAVLGYRLVLGCAVGAIGATAAMLLALTATQLGWIDAGPRPTESVVASEADEWERTLVAAATVLEEARRAGQDAIEDPSTTAAASGRAFESPLNEVSPGLGPAVSAWLDRFTGFLQGIGEHASQQWDALPKPLRTLLLASGAAGGFLGFVAGLAFPTWAAAMLTSLFGSLLVLLCGAPLLSRVMSPEALPALRPLGWLGAWLGLAAAGWCFQWWTRPKRPAATERKAEGNPEAAKA